MVNVAAAAGVEAAVAALFARLNVDAGSVPEAANALAMARLIDDPKNSATSQSMCSDRLMGALAAVRALAAANVDVSPLDEIKQRRDAKLGVSAPARRTRS